MKKAAILGSTGSIGRQTLSLIREDPELGAASLAALRNIDLLEAQIREFKPGLACVYDEVRAADLKLRVRDTGTKIVTGMDGLIEAASVSDADLTVGAVVGMVGLRPTLEAIRAGKDIALANKETLVTAGHLILPEVRDAGVRLLPVDSEHSAIFQCLRGEEENPVERILLTASGGPFRTWTKEQLKTVHPEDALKHPNWSMGAKITVDSSTMVNKGLEVMEAHWLFGVDYDRIEVVVQPQSVIHSMVEFRDGAVKAQLGTPDMRIPIAYALYYPERREVPGQRLDFKTLSEIRFEALRTDVFEALPMAYEAGKKGGNAPTVYNAANEWAVARFLSGKLSYLDIIRAIRFATARVTYIPDPSLPEILETERETCEVLACLQ